MVKMAMVVLNAQDFLFFNGNIHDFKCYRYYKKTAMLTISA